ncbi:MAG: CDP-diacylglycerol--glycerol-3-phosphate 3-phosphatidyltransferase [Shinella sp.]|nr:MAG: CDP-diacylglycerol--glycerol-3-phosphate 3-phosphatidyltransferase [Shinella sp.]
MASRAYNLPNILTYARIVAVPIIVLCFFVEGKLQSSDFARWTALWLFILASITDFFDGYLARIWNQTSNIGRMLDPIADKLLVASVLLLMAADGTIAGWTIWAAIIILCREILVSGLREYLAALTVSVPVTRIAKWKTTIQMVAIALLLAGSAGDAYVDHLIHGVSAAGDAHSVLPIITYAGIFMLWIAAALTMYTGYDYFKAGVKHIVDE